MADIKITKRDIIHCDMDAFYASVEQLKNPQLRGKPVVVGGRPQSRGVVSACSYEARRFGIRSAMPLAEAYRLCPHAVFLTPDFVRYKEISRQMHEIFYEYTPVIEPISLDEAFLDVSESVSLFGSASGIGHKIKNRIKTELGLVASVGVAHNKFIAKLASDLSKPDGFIVVSPNRVQEFLDPLDVGRIWGVGNKTAQTLYRLNIKTIRELRGLDESYLVSLLGSYGHQLYLLARGMDNRPVEGNRRIKSVGRETTFAEDIKNQARLEKTVLELSAEVGRNLRKKGLKGRTITLKIRYSDFKTLTRSETLEAPTDNDLAIYQAASRLLHKLAPGPTRLVGVSVHNLVDSDRIQLSLFETQPDNNSKLMKVVDLIKDRFGDNSITMARLLEPGD